MLKAEELKERAVARYNKFTKEFSVELRRQKAERLEDVKAALKASKERLRKTTDATEEELEIIAKAVKKEARETLGKAKKGLRKLENQAWTRPSQRIMNEARSLLRGVSGKVKSAAGEVENGLEKGMAYFSKEKVKKGNYACKRCDNEIVIPSLAALPECPECGGNVFKKM